MEQNEIKIRTENLYVVEFEEGQRSYLYRDTRIKYVGTDYIIISADEGYDILYTSEEMKKRDFWTAIYSEIRDFQEGLAAVLNNNGKWGFINKNGELIIEEKYTFVSDFHNGYAIVEDDNEVYRINTKGERIDNIKKECEDKPYIDMRAGIEKYLKENPRDNILKVYNDLGIAVVYYDGKDFYENVGCIDKNGDIVIGRNYICDLEFENGIACTNGFTGYGYAYVNQTKTQSGEYINSYSIVPPHFKIARSYLNGMGAIQDFNNRWSFINLDKTIISDFTYKNVENFTENGTAHVQDEKDNWIYIDKNNRKIVRLEKVYVIDVPSQFRLCGLTKEEVLRKAKDYTANFKCCIFNEDPKHLKLILR